jgi:hypothetical protein
MYFVVAASWRGTYFCGGGEGRGVRTWWRGGEREREKLAVTCENCRDGRRDCEFICMQYMDI